METFLTILHVLICIFLILVVLLQTGKGGGMGAAFGGGSQTVFGGSGASSFLKKLTAFAAAGFMLTSIVLAYLSSSVESSLQQKSEALKALADKKDAGIPPEEPLLPLQEEKPAADAGRPTVSDAGQDAATAKAPDTQSLPEPVAEKPAAPKPMATTTPPAVPEAAKKTDVAEPAAVAPTPAEPPTKAPEPAPKPAPEPAPAPEETPDPQEDVSN